MQISIIKYTDIQEARRFDAEYFRIQDIVKKIDLMSSAELKNISDWVTQGPNPIFSQNGISCLTGRNIATGKIIFKNSDIIDEEEYQKLKRFTLKNDDILITLKGAGSTGKIALFNSNTKSIFSRNIGLIRLEKNAEVMPRFLFTFLSSSVGQKIIDRGVTGGTGQLTLPTGFLKKIKIPILSQSFQLQTDKTVKEAHQKQFQSKRLYKEAEELLLKELGLLDYEVKHTLSFATTKKEIDQVKRYDAEYFQPKYEKIIEKIEKYKGGSVNLGDKNFAELRRGSLVPDKFYTQKKGLGYIRGADFSNGILSREKLVYINKNFEINSETLILENDIIFSLIGSVGASALVSEDFANYFISNNTGKISLKSDFSAIVLQVFLQSIAGQLQFEKEKMQTAQPKISTKEMNRFKIPLIKSSIQNQIAKRIQESHKLRKESKELLEKAKRKVEEEIEK